MFDICFLVSGGASVRAAQYHNNNDSVIIIIDPGIKFYTGPL